MPFFQPKSLSLSDLFWAPKSCLDVPCVNFTFRFFRQENETLKLEVTKQSSKINQFEEAVEDWKEKFFSADATAEALKADLKVKQANLDQIKQNLKEAQKHADEKSAEIVSLKGKFILNSCFKRLIK